MNRWALLVVGVFILAGCSTMLEGGENDRSPAAPTVPLVETPVPSPPATTPTIIPTAAPSQDELTVFLSQFSALLEDSDFDGSAQALMGSEFGYGQWRAEWQTLAPENAVQYLSPLFEENPNVILQLMSDEPAALLDGLNPYQMLGPENEIRFVGLIQKLGADQQAEAIVFFTSKERRIIWEALLVAPDGFQPTTETIPPPEGLIYRIYGDGVWVINQDSQPESVFEAEGLPSPGLSYFYYPDFETNRTQVSIVDLSDDSQRRIALPGRLVGCYVWQSETHLLCGIRFDDEEDAPDLGHLTRIGVEDGTVEVIERERLQFSPPSVSPDGQTIAFDGNGREIFLWQDGAVEPFAHTLFSGLPEAGLRAIASPSFSPDGTRLAFIVPIESGNAIAIFDLAAGTAKLLHEFQPEGFGGYFPPVVWSPDSRWLAAQLFAYPPEEAGLWLIAADGSQELRLGDRSMQTPLWLSEAALLYTRNAEGKLSTIEQYNLVSGQTSTLAFPEGAYLIGLIH